MEKESSILTKYGGRVVEWITRYWSDLRNDHTRFIIPNRPPGAMRALFPLQPPEDPEDFEEVMKDMNEVVMPNVLHWMSPHFHAYFTSANSAASLLGDMVSAAINSIGFSWISNPAATELGVHVVDWLARMLDLPEIFRFDSGLGGGGVILGSASEATFLALLSARERFIKLHVTTCPFIVMSKLVGYTSKEAHSSVRRAGLLARCTIRLVTLKNNHAMDTDDLISLIKQDIADGFIPAFICATWGTTGVCAFDDLTEIGRIAKQWNIWVHVDAAYGGNALICPEYRYLMKGAESLDSIVVSPHKWMMVNYDCSVMWVRSQDEFTSPFIVEPEYLKHQHDFAHGMPDYRHWHISCGRRFRALKLWFVIRMHGISGLQDNIRKQVQLGNYFADLVIKEPRLQLVTNNMGVVSFRTQGSNRVTELLLGKINSTRKIRVVHTKIDGNFVIRFVASGSRSTFDDIEYAWNIVVLALDSVLDKENIYSVQLKSIGNRRGSKSKRSETDDDAFERFLPQQFLDTDD